MDQIFSLIGSIASIGSIPLAIYLFLKSKDEKYDKVRKDIIKTLSYQIGDKRNLSTFEISTVIKSKLREKKIKESFVSISSIIEDLVSETISSPLLEKERKELIITNLKQLYVKGNVREIIDSIENESINIIDDKKIKNDKELEDKLKEKFDKNVRVFLDRKYLSNELIERKNKTYSYFTSIFGLIAVLITILFSLFTLVGKNEIEKIFDLFKFDNLSIILTMFASIFVTILASVLTGIISYIIKKKKK